MMTLLVLAVALICLGVGYVAGIAHAVRVWKRTQPGAAPAGARSVPFPGTSCDKCRETFPDWWCWLGGCP